MTHHFLSRSHYFCKECSLSGKYQIWVQGCTNVMPLSSAGVGVPGLFHGLLPGQGLTLLPSPYFIFSQFEVFCVEK